MSCSSPEGRLRSISDTETHQQREKILGCDRWSCSQEGFQASANAVGVHAEQLASVGVQPPFVSRGSTYSSAARRRS